MDNQELIRTLEIALASGPGRDILIEKVIDYFKEAHKTKLDDVNPEACQCDECNERPAMHTKWEGEKKTRLCCQCHIKQGHPPAEWHPLCMEAYNSSKDSGTTPTPLPHQYDRACDCITCKRETEFRDDFAIAKHRRKVREIYGDEKKHQTVLFSFESDHAKKVTGEWKADIANSAFPSLWAKWIKPNGKTIHINKDKVEYYEEL